MSARPLSRGERLDWLRLARTPRVGPISFHRLLTKWGGPRAALEALARHTPDVAPPSVETIQREIDALHALGGVFVCSCEEDYPPLLAQLEAPPPVLSARGDLTLAHRPCVAIVGAREASAAGLLLAERFAADLGARGWTIVSGLARGIDAAAHRAALETGTIAVLAGGLDKPYPPQNLALHQDIIGSGLVLSEAPLGAVARAKDFPRRNHIVSGLARGVVVIEAALRSGSLITARAAAEQGRDVMAAPGSPLDPRARGANALIKTGAALVEDAEDVLAVLGAAPEHIRRAPAPPLEPEPPPDADLADRLLQRLSPAPVHVNDLARLLGAGTGAVAAALTELELDGRAATLSGGYAVRLGG